MHLNILCLFCRTETVLTLKKLDESPTHRTQTELLGVDVIGTEPHALGSIITCHCHCGVLHLAEIEHVERVDVDATITIDIGQREKILRRSDFKPSFLHHLAAYALLRGLANLGESTWQIECTLGWLLLAALNENLTLGIADDSNV